MSIANEITRLQTAKADLKTSIENKGVEIPTSATIDEYPQYIDQLSAGDVVNGVIEEYLASIGRCHRRSHQNRMYDRNAWRSVGSRERKFIKIYVFY